MKKRFNSRRRNLALAVSVWLAWAGVASAANVLQTFFVSIPEDEMQISMNAVAGFNGAIGNVMQAAISMVVGTDGTIIYYDHWEDGYEDDITSPMQLTTQIWGDGNPDNGYPPGIPSDVLNAGTVVRLESQIDVTRNSVTIEYDGRDKVATTFPIAMTRAMYAVTPGEVLSEAIGVYDIGSHGTEYRAPVGEGTGVGANTNEMFSYTALYIMADYDFTRIEIDADNDGTFEQTVYLNQGEPFFVNGGVKAGATVRGSQPFACSLVTGDIGSTYEMRWFELWPETQWDSDYFSPVASRGGVRPATADVYLFNPNPNAITVTATTATSTGTIVIAANSVGANFRMPVDGSARFTAADGSPFIGVSLFDTSGTCQSYDWGIGLMPERMMSTAGVVGWGPGYGTTDVGTNGNPIWVASISNTTLYVDYDGDPSTGDLIDAQGSKYDFATNMTALMTVSILDPDGDQTGLRYYTLDGTVVLGAWGQDSRYAQTGVPYLDMGYAIPAFPTIISKKFATLLVDNNDNGYPDAGDTLEYIIDVVNVGFATATHVIFEDQPPTNLTTYATNTAFVAGLAAPDNLPPKLTRFPFDEGGYDIGTIGLGQTTTVRYVTQIVTNLPTDFNGYIHNNATVGGTNGNWTTISTTNVLIRGLSILKQTSTTNLLEPGSNFTYTITVANTGQVAYTGLRIEDELPLGVTYVSNSALIAFSGALTNTVADRFDQRSFTNSNGSIPWLTSWQETGEADGVAAGGVQVIADVMANSVEAYALRIGDFAARGAVRQANLSGHSSATLSFKYRRVALDGATDSVAVYISSNNWVSSNLLVNIQGTANDADYVSVNYNVSAYISSNTGIRVLGGTLGTGDYIYFDDMVFTATGSNPTFAGNPPPVLAENLTLLPGGTATVTFAVTVVNPPVATQVVNVAQARADQQLVPLEADPVTNAIHATAGITLLKTSSTTNLLAAGTNVTYTILISNTGTVAQNNIQLEDLLPAGMTYSNGSAKLIRTFPHTNTFLDVFNFQTYSNSDGNVAWSGPWTEIGDDGNPTNGNIQLMVDGGSIPGQTYAMRTLSTVSVQREANLAGYPSATLSFDYRRTGLEAGEFVNVNVSANGGGAFTQVGQIGGATNDGSYFTASFNISAYASTGTVIRFTGSAGRDTTTDIVWLDNIRIAAAAVSATNALPDPPTLLDGYSLPPLTNMTVRLTATVDNPITATTFINTARLVSDQQTTWITSSVTNAAPGTIGMTITKASSLSTNWNYGATNTYTLTIRNTGTLAQTGVNLTDILPTGVTYVAGSAYVMKTSITYTANSAFTGPADTTWMTVEAWAGGGGGARRTSNGAGGGGGGGAYSRSVLMAMPSSNYTVTVGAGGAQNTTGGDSWFALGSVTGVLAKAGIGCPLNIATGAAGGSAANGRGDVLYDGGSGANGVTASYGGGGGSSAGTNAAGVSATVAAGATAPPGGGNGGAGKTTPQGAGTAGSAPGGGGGGALRTANNQNGGAGALGQLVITYPYPDITVGSPPNLLTNYTLLPGAVITISFGAQLTAPLTTTQIINTASVSSTQQPPREASVTNYSVANSVGNYVWSDANGNGIQNGGVETGLVGVVVRLYGSNSNLLLTTTSGVAGAYAFTNLPTGSYFLEFVTPSNYVTTLQDQGGDDALDSDISTNTGRTAAFTLGGGTNDTSRDAGYYQPPSSLGNFTWRDVNGNGIQSGGTETGLVGVVVRLYDASSNVVGVTTSSAVGLYSFTNLPTGNYFLQFTAPANFTLTLQDQGADDTVDSDPSPSTGYTAQFFLPPGTNDTRWDAGFSAAVYGLTISKTSDAGSCLAPGATNTYTIVVQNTGTVAQSGIAIEDLLPAGLTYVPSSVSASFYAPTTTTYDSSTTFTVPAGNTSVTVQVWGGGGGGATRTTTGNGGGGGGGAYSRANVAVQAGSNYTVNVGGGGAANTGGGASWFSLGSTTGALARGGSGAANNSANGAAGGATATGIGTTLYAGGTGANGAGTYGGGGGSSAGTGAVGTTAVNATGAVAPAGGGNGGNGRSGSSGVGLSGSAPGGGGGGAYRTSNGTSAGGAGAAGRVIVSYIGPASSSGTLGAPPNLWTGGILGTGATITITFQATVDSPSPLTQAVNTASTYSAVQPVRSASVTNCVQTADVGVQKFATTNVPYPAQIIEYILVATNRGPDTATGVKITDVLPAQVQYNSYSNGTYDAGSGLWTIGTLAAYASTTLYINVTVRENTDGMSIPNTATITGRDLYDPVSSNDTNTVVITPKAGAIGNYTWVDSNLNGQQDGGDVALSNVVVTLYNASSNVIGITTSSVLGAYAFTNLPPGSYFVSFAPPAGYLFTTSNVGDDATDSDPLAGTNRTALITLTLGQTDNSVDAGFYQLAAVGDRVWFDANLDGIQDQAETNNIVNMPVALLDAASNVVATRTTASDGSYLFENVMPGSYYVRFDMNSITSHSWITTAKAGGNDAMDSDAILLATNGYAWTASFTLTGGQTNRNVDLGIRPQKSTRAEMAEMWGEWANGEGRVVWRTSSEWGTAGFFVYRVDPETGEETRLNDVLLPSAFRADGSVYDLADPAAREGDAGTYRLEEMELMGGRVDMGEHALVFGPTPAAAKAARAEVKAAKTAAAPTLLAETKAVGPSAVLKVKVKTEGVYGVALQDIATGMGRTLEDLQALAAENGLAITEQGVPVPMLVDAARGRLVFHGQGTRDWYTRDNAYLISEGVGLAMPRREPGASSGDAVFPVTVRFEQDRYPFDSAMQWPEDFYYWNYVLSATNVTATSVGSFPIDLTGCTGDVTLRVRLMGWSSTTNDPDHLAEFSFNGTVVGTATFDGQNVEEAVLTLPSGSVLNGVNTLAVRGILQPGRSFSYFVVDWIDASFERELAPLADTAFFRASGAAAVSAAAFAEPLALALDESGNPTWIADETGTLPTKAWTVAATNECFAVAEASDVPLLTPEAAAADAWFLSETNRIDYLVIASRALAPAAQELADYRASQGLRVGVAVFEDVCDLMEGGLRTPEAIPKLLGYAKATWAGSPWMAVLAGNGHYDYLGALSNEVNHLPPLLTQTQDGLFAEDGLLADIDGDTLPDLAIGRLPALMTNDLTAMIAKIKAYESGFGQAWENQWVLASETNDTAAGNFAAANTELASLAGAKYPVARIDLDTMAIAPARTALTNWFKTGAGILHYTGHGGVNTWSGKGLLKAADVNVMTNARPPVVVALSCLVGRYEAPKVDSLGELLLRRAQGGAVAAWGPSGMSRSAPASELAQAFYHAVLQQGSGTLGLAILEARRSLSGNLFTKDTYGIYNLLGDPALRIAGNTAGLPSDATFAQWRWQRFSPQALTNAAASGSTTNNFFNYALNGGYDIVAELPEFGYDLPAGRMDGESAGEPGFILRWKRRIHRSDVDYQLFVSENLAEWTLEPEDVQTEGVEPDVDGVMETVRTRVNRPLAERVFIGVKAVRK